MKPQRQPTGAVTLRSNRLDRLRVRFVGYGLYREDQRCAAALQGSSSSSEPVSS